MLLQNFIAIATLKKHIFYNNSTNPDFTTFIQQKIYH